MEANPKKQKRFRILDLLRGVAVLAMILAHSVYFLYKGENPLVLSLETLGNTICYTLFLLVSGATFYIAYFKNEERWRKKTKRLKSRILMLAGAYYALALFVSYDLFVKAQGLDKLATLFDIATLRLLPSYTEFLPPFFIYPLLFLLMPRLLRKVFKNNYSVAFLSVALYIIGFIIYQIPVWEFLIPWKALISGSEGFFRFPILQYAPVYLVGVMWGKMMTRATCLKEKREISHNLALIFSSALALIFFVYLISGVESSKILLRWPPSVPFLLFGLAISFLLSSLFYKLKLLKNFDITRDTLLILGQNALGFVVTHVFLLTIYTFIGAEKTDMISIWLFGFALVTILSAALTAFIPFNFKLSLTLHRHDHYEDELLESPIMNLEEDIAEEAKEDIARIERFFLLGRFKRGKSKELIKKRHVLGSVILVSLVSFIIVPPITEHLVITRNNQTEKNWWNENYAYRQEFRVKNLQTFAGINKGSQIALSINHKGLVENKKSNADGSDIALVYWNGKGYVDVDYKIVNSFLKEDTQISFGLVESINNSAESKPYFLYYGHPTAENTHEKNKQELISDNYYSIDKNEEESYDFRLALNKKWVLIGNNNYEPKLKATLITKNDLEIEEVDLKISGFSKKGKLKKTDNNTWEGVINLEGIDPGIYKARAVISDGLSNIYSQNVGFYASYPLYVSWSIDWEGYNPTDSNLANMESVSEKYDIPMTHLFNPRIYVTDTISESRASYLTNWVKRRVTKGDAIGLHLHMFYDFVEAAGVKVKKTPNWGDSGDGYGSLTTNYNENEMLKILNLALDLFNKNGLPKPIVYRAGGWFANLDTLKALEDAGIKADSSARTAYYFYDIKGPWDIAEDAQPYYPSTLNQNSSQTPSLSVLEIPNNGADSYWFSEKDLLNRFTNLYNPSEKILTDKKQLTYLSHPNWFTNKEKAKIEPALSMIDSYSYKNDSGPIIYTTLNEVYETWK